MGAMTRHRSHARRFESPRRYLPRRVMEESGEHVVFKQDHWFKFASSAAIALAGRTANG